MLRFIDSFDHWASGDVLTKYQGNSGGAISAGNGRNGTASWRTTSTASGLDLVLDAQATWIVGHSYRQSSIPAANRGIFALASSTTIHVTVNWNSVGKMLVMRGDDAGTLLATSATTFVNNTVYFLEWYFTISDTVGVVKCRVNGVAEVFTFVTGTETTQDTRNGTPTTADTILFHGANSGGGNADRDDVYVCDGVDGTTPQGAPNNDFLGDCRVECLLPSGNGNASQLVGSDSNSTDNYLLVDEATPNGDTDYVASATTTERDTYAMGNLATTSGTIIGIQELLFARKDDAGSRQIAPVLRISSTDYAGTNAPLADSYRYTREVAGKSPASGVRFTVAEVNGLEFGPKVTV